MAGLTCQATRFQRPGQSLRSRTARTHKDQLRRTMKLRYAYSVGCISHDASNVAALELLRRGLEKALRFVGQRPSHGGIIRLVTGRRSQCHVGFFSCSLALSIASSRCLQVRYP